MPANLATCLPIQKHIKCLLLSRCSRSRLTLRNTVPLEDRNRGRMIAWGTHLLAHLHYFPRSGVDLDWTGWGWEHQLQPELNSQHLRPFSSLFSTCLFYWFFFLQNHISLSWQFKLYYVIQNSTRQSIHLTCNWTWQLWTTVELSACFVQV